MNDIPVENEVPLLMTKLTTKTTEAYENIFPKANSEVKSVILRTKRFIYLSNDQPIYGPLLGTGLFYGVEAIGQHTCQIAGKGLFKQVFSRCVPSSLK